MALIGAVSAFSNGISKRAAISVLAIAAARGERQVLPLQTKRINFGWGSLTSPAGNCDSAEE